MKATTPAGNNVTLFVRPCPSGYDAEYTEVRFLDCAVSGFGSRWGCGSLAEALRVADTVIDHYRLCALDMGCAE